MDKLNILLKYALVSIVSGWLLSCSGSGWIADSKTGCIVYNPRPMPNETITYEGECVEGKAQGVGKLFWYQDDVLVSVYQGYFNKGKWEGNVIVHYFNSPLSSFEGTYTEARRNGPGVFTYTFGKRVECSFKDGKQVGQSRIVWRNGKTYAGTLKDYEMEGFGSMQFPNGDHYEGEFKQNKRDGRGVYIWANGDRFEGKYFHDHRQSEGTYYYSDLNSTLELKQEQMEQPSLLVTGLADPEVLLQSASNLQMKIERFLRYPDAALKARAETRVRVTFLVGIDGAVKECQPITSEHPEMFSEINSAIVREVSRATFPITSEEGEPYEVWVVLPIRFRLR